MNAYVLETTAQHVPEQASSEEWADRLPGRTDASTQRADNHTPLCYKRL